MARYRCNGCGNLTRFDVVASRRTKAFHHFDLAGELVVEDEVVLDEEIEQVVCRWCSSARSVEVIPEPEDDFALAGERGLAEARSH